MSGLFASFDKSVRDIRACWHLWHELFDLERVESPEAQAAFEARHHDMERVAPTFFMHVRWSLLNNVLLGLMRLADPASNRHQENVTLERVFDATDFCGQPGLRHMTLNARDHALETLRSPAFRELRDKVLAHNDVEVALGRRTPDVVIDEVGLAVRTVSSFAERIHFARAGRPADYASGVGLYPDESDAAAISDEIQRLVRALAGFSVNRT